MILDNIPCETSVAMIRNDQTLRLKVTSNCPWSCHFCHKEGNEDSNDIILNENFFCCMDKLRKELKYPDVHLTGGEPTIYKNCANLIKQLSDMGYNVKMTSNAQCSVETIKKLKESGLISINISMHTLNAKKLGEMQYPQKTEEWGMEAIERQTAIIHCAKEIGLRVKINSVVQTIDDVNCVIDFCQKNEVELRLLNDLNPLSLSTEKIIESLKQRGSVINNVNNSNNSSSYSFDVVTREGLNLKVKSIKKHLLNSICTECNKRTECEEWFYGIRIEQQGEELFVRLCLYRNDYPAIQRIDKFLTSMQLEEIKKQAQILTEKNG